MKEVLTRKFWQGVKNTFNEALDGPPPKTDDSHAPEEGKRAASSPETTADAGKADPP